MKEGFPRPEILTQGRGNTKMNLAKSLIQNSMNFARSINAIRAFYIHTYIHATYIIYIMYIIHIYILYIHLYYTWSHAMNLIGPKVWVTWPCIPTLFIAHA